MYNTHPKIQEKKKWIKNSSIIQTDFLEFPAAKFNLNLKFVQLFISPYD